MFWGAEIISDFKSDPLQILHRGNGMPEMLHRIVKELVKW